MMEKRNFKVVIVGGSIAGLTLANMLERIGVDYVVLEKYPEIAPQVGASIGLFPNGLRILDQLGIADAIKRVDETGGTFMTIRDTKGEKLSSFGGIASELIQRHGYPFNFIDRQLAIQVLYDNLQHKENVLAGKNIVNITKASSSVEVVTQNGETFSGDILVGADGIHSSVRSLMWNLANKVQPGYFPHDELSKVPCDYKCLFGISNPLKAFPTGLQSQVLGNGHSYLIAVGPGGRLYWFLFANIGGRKYGKDIPRYTKQDEALFVEQRKDDVVGKDGATFGDIYENRVISVLTALEEYVFEKWHFQRIITIGDAAHKKHPLTGQGGNGAIETAAALTNVLHRMLSSHSGKGGPTDADIHAAFVEVQASRSKRAQYLVDLAHTRQRIFAQETWVPESITRLLISISGRGVFLDNVADSIVDANRLEMLDLPTRRTLIPYRDQLPEKPFKKIWPIKLLFGAALLALFFLTFKLSNGSSLDFHTFAGQSLKQEFTGIPGIDQGLSFVVSLLSHGAAGGVASTTQAIYFWVQLTPLAVLWTVDGYRNGATKTLLSLPVIWGMLYLVFGICRIAPLYYLVSIFCGICTDRVSRSVPVEAAQAIIPATSLGFILPTILFFMRFEEGNMQQQDFVALWLSYPVYCSLLVAVIAAAIRLFNKPKVTSATDATNLPVDNGAEQDEDRDVRPLRQAYAFAIAVMAIAHISLLLFIFFRSDLTFADVFADLPEILSDWTTFEESIVAFFLLKYDMLIYVLAQFIYSVYVVVELRMLGYITTATAINAVLTVTVDQVLVSPGAACVGLWYWREGVIASLGSAQQRHSPVVVPKS